MEIEGWVMSFSQIGVVHENFKDILGGGIFKDF